VAGDPADQSHREDSDGGDVGLDQTAGDRSHQDGDIGPRLDQAGAAEHLVLPQMLRQHRIFDRPEEARMDPHREQRREHQRDVVEEKAGRSEHHDGDLGRLHEADDARLVHRIGELSRKRREQEEGEDEDGAGNGVERRFLGRVGIDVIGDQDHHRGLEQIVVERAQELGDEQRQEAPLGQEVERILHGAQARAAGVRTSMRGRS
jgi:hypothetical protein